MASWVGRLVMHPPPIILLARPQLGENIGMVARAMANFGLSQLRLIAPRDGWPNPDAWPPAVGATAILENAQVFETVEEAASDLETLFATTAQPRDMASILMTPEVSMQHLEKRCGFLFGAEQSGLTNAEISRCRAIIQIPTDPSFSSLNLAQAVLLVASSWWRAKHEMPREPIFRTGESVLATHQEVTYFLEQLERALDAREHFRVPHKKSVMLRNLQHIFRKAPLTSQDVQTLRGVVTSLSLEEPVQKK